MVSKRFDSAWYDEPARRMAEGLVEAERRRLAEKRKLEDCDCKESHAPLAWLVLKCRHYRAGCGGMSTTTGAARVGFLP